MTALTRIQTLGLPLAACLLLPSMSIAQVDRTKAPEPGPAPIVQVGAHKSFTLPNGIHVIVVENHKLPMVSLQVRFDIPPFLQGEAAGYTDLAGDLLASGTSRRTKEEIDAMVDRLGASLSTSSDGLYASSLSKNFPDMMRLVYEITTNATFPPGEFEKAKTRMLSGVQSRKDDPEAIADQVARVMTYGKGHPYGEVVTEESLTKVTRGMVSAYYKRFFRPGDNVYLVFVGDITEGSARELSTKYFAEWVGAEVSTTTGEGTETIDGLGTIRYPRAEPAPTGVRRVAFVDRPGAAQSVIRVVFPERLKPNDPHLLEATVMNTILGGGVFNARLMQNLREDKAFTYGAYSSLDPDRYAGSFSAGCGVRTEVTDSAVTEIMFELEHMKEGVKPAELSLAKNYMAGSFARSLEDPRTIARFALNTQLNGLAPDHYQTYLKRLDAVSAEGVQQAAKALLFPDNAVILVVGDREKVANTLVPLSFEPGVAYFDENGDVFRETAEAAPKGMKVSDVLAAYYQACGGKAAMEQVKDVRTEMTTSIQGMPVTMTQWNASPNKYRMEMKSGAMVLQSMVFDGTRGMSGGMQGERELIEDELQDLSDNAYAFSELHYGDLHYEMLLNGVVDVDGKKAYKITAHKENGGVFYEYYDVETGLKLRRTEPKSEEGQNMVVTTDYKDYKPVSGVLFPHTIEQNVGMQMIFTVTKVEVNKGVDPALFVIQP